MLQVYAKPTPQKENATDAAAERETVISWSDADQVITIHTAQQKQITALKKNPAAVLLETDGTNYRFELPLGLITIRKGKNAGNGAPKGEFRGKNAAKCGHIKDDGTPCQMVAKKDTGRCRWHS